MTKKIKLLLPFMCLFLFCGKHENSLSPEDFKKAVSSDNKAVIVDVRTAQEYYEGHIEGAILMDVSSSGFDDLINSADTSATYYIYCRSGNRSKVAFKKMQNRGLKVFELEGGIMAWVKKDWPLSK